MRSPARTRRLAQMIKTPEVPSNLFELRISESGTSYAPVSEDHVINEALRLIDRRMARGVQITSVADVKRFLTLHLACKDREEFGVIFLDTPHHVLGFEIIFQGTLDEAQVYPRDVIKKALAYNAKSIIVAHNHPSGSPEPSSADQWLTQRLGEACQIMGIRLLDHILVAGATTVSFKEAGLMVDPPPGHANRGMKP